MSRRNVLDQADGFNDTIEYAEELADDFLAGAHLHPCLECRLEAMEDELVKLTQRLETLEAKVESQGHQGGDSGSSYQGEPGDTFP